MTERAEADSLGIADGTMLIGDSVALRANTALQTALPGAQINAQVSRTPRLPTKSCSTIARINFYQRWWLLRLG